MATVRAPRPQRLPPPAKTRNRWRIPLVAGAVLTLATLAAGGVALMIRARPAAAGAGPSTSSTANSERPAWAAATGHDAYGTWADLRVGSLTQRLRLMPAGENWMGSAADEAGRSDAENLLPARFTHGLWLADTETTQAFYQEIVGTNPSRFSGATLPVDNVTWTAAVSFCQHLMQRMPNAQVDLPSEAWWERACRAGRTGPFSTALDGRQLDVWDSATSGDMPHPVGRLAANAWGLFDMHGNSLEWTADASAPYISAAMVDRQVPHGAQRIARGGAWCMERADSRAAARFHLMPAAHFSHLGFRFAIAE